MGARALGGEGRGEGAGFSRSASGSDMARSVKSTKLYVYCYVKERGMVSVELLARDVRCGVGE